MLLWLTMDIIYLGHSSFKISGKTGTVVTDPFDSSMAGFKFPKTSADIVTVSHDHPDHNFVSGVEETKKVLDNPGEYEILGISFLGYKSFHDAEQGAARGENTIFVIEMDGFRIAHLGDLGHTLSDELVTDIGNIDVLFIPVGGHFTIGAEDAVKVTRAIEPTFVIPMHFKTAEHTDAAFADLAPVETFVTALGATPERMKKLSIKAGALPTEEMKLVILER